MICLFLGLSIQLFPLPEDIMSKTGGGAVFIDGRISDVSFLLVFFEALSLWACRKSGNYRHRIVAVIHFFISPSCSMT